MKPANMNRFRQRRAREGGQTMTLVLLGLGLFLLGAVGIAVDVSNWWFHRQLAQGAADAACTAGVMDLLVSAEGVGSGGFPTGSPPASFACSSASGAASATCKYAALNGYNGTGRVAGQASNDVLVSFPGSVPGLNICSDTNPPPCVPVDVGSPFIQVNVLDRVPTTFTGLVSGSRTTDVAGSAVCGVLQSTAPVPIIVLNPTCQHAFQLSGNTNIKIVGGPTRSVQVNSCAPCTSGGSCAAATSNAGTQCNSTGPTIDLSKGGPNYSGSEFAVFGQPKTAPSGFNPGTTGDWGTGAPISDPYALVPAPTVPPHTTTDNGNAIVTGSVTNFQTKNINWVPHNTDGCPDTIGCIEFRPGLYNNPIIVKGYTAIFVPGVYYMKGTNPDNSGSPGNGCIAGPTGQSRYVLDVDAQGVLRPSTAVGDGSNGVMFYMSGSGGAGTYGSVFFGSNAGKAGSRTINDFVTANATCPGGTAPPVELGIPSQLPGNVLLGPCTSKGTYIGLGSTDTTGAIRGLIFFQNRANADAKGQASMQGGGGLVISGNMYFHNCNASGTGTGCSAPLAGYNAFYQLQGTPGGTAYVLGNITTDELVLGGGGTIAMSLNPNAIYNILKASLLQ